MIPGFALLHTSGDLTAKAENAQELHVHPFRFIDSMPHSGSCRQWPRVLTITVSMMCVWISLLFRQKSKVPRSALQE
jgi:hypothetical protein